MNEHLLFDFFKKHEIAFHLFEHQPVFTITDEPVITAIDGVKTSAGVLEKPHFKTLLTKDKNNVFFLLSVIEDKRVDLNALSKALGCGRLSFANPEELLELLQLTPGSVTPYGLMFDQTNKVTFVLDEDALALSSIGFHALRNDMTVVTTPQIFLKCMELMNHNPRIIHIPVKLEQ